ncbi:hypothetical protein RvY_02766 [Ramazzottius varieornatus]|uniref:tRNA(His) guanylyltransferase n=1 Tax=Ramazzottius varieornatus TaxID=947166 RepID=A0A1D1USX8_RAMVA|nr:hypothetical protein RvY_02766 [Ramazzottius varieornatus]
MAKSSFEYVKLFERSDVLLPQCWPVVRIDGRGFHRFSDVHGFRKPNDDRSLGLMNKAATSVMKDFKDVVIAYGQSDEYSFVLDKKTNLYNRRESKILSNMVSLFTSCFTFHWSEFFPTTPLKYAPSFDGRVILYPSKEVLRDYLSWRQADCHINNLYNTVFWALVQEGGLTPNEAQVKLKGTNAGGKNEILFSQFGVNYNNLSQLYRKGTVLMKALGSNLCAAGDGDKPSDTILSLNEDIIRDDFWKAHPEILRDEGENLAKKNQQ